MDLHEYRQRQRECSARGSDLPQSKLTPDAVEAIRDAAKKREELRDYIRDELSNVALAKKYGVHYRTVEKCLSRDTWSHV